MNESALRFQFSLQSFDPLLSLRWGPFVNKWVIQRRSLIPDAEMRFLQRERGRLHKKFLNGELKDSLKTRYAGVAEEHECALQGKRVIIFIDNFSPEIFNTLAMGDIRRYGGYSRYTDKQDELVAQQEAIADKEAENKRAIIHAETWGRGGISDFLHKRKQTQIHQFGIRDMRSLLGTDVFESLK